MVKWCNAIYHGDVEQANEIAIESKSGCKDRYPEMDSDDPTWSILLLMNEKVYAFKPTNTSNP